MLKVLDEVDKNTTTVNDVCDEMTNGLQTDVIETSVSLDTIIPKTPIENRTM